MIKAILIVGVVILALLILAAVGLALLDRINERGGSRFPGSDHD